MTEPAWTLAALKEHLQVVQQLHKEFNEERDRRYAEVNVEREKALKIKETADLAALQLAREIQTYKDEKANELREQINSERGLYATKNDLRTTENTILARIEPLSRYVNTQTGHQSGTIQTRDSTRQLYTMAISLLVLLVGFLGFYAATHHT